MNKYYSVNSHIKSIETPFSLRFDYILALLPLIVCSILRFGVNSLLLFGAAIFSVCVSDIIFKSIKKRKFVLPSLYSVYGSIVFVFTLYPTTSIHVAFLGGTLIGILINLLGGEENCFIFCPLIARIIAFSTLTSFINIPQNLPYISILNGSLPQKNTLDLMIGISDGSIYASSIAALIIGAIYLLIRKSFNFKVCSSYILTTIVLALIFPAIEGRAFESLLYEFLSGGIIFVAVFVLTDMPTTPKNANLRYIKGFICAITTYILKNYLNSQDPLDCYYVAVIVADVIIVTLSIITEKIKIAKELKNGK